MSDYVPPTSYAGSPTDKYGRQFRALVMNFFMNNLKMNEVEMIFFLFKMPERLRDHGAAKFRFEVLTHVDNQLMEDWIQTPTLLQDLLKEIDRTDLSNRVQELVDRFPKMSEEESLPQEASSTDQSQRPPVEETQTFTETPDMEDRSSTEGLAREVQPVAENGDLQSSRHAGISKTTREYMEKIPEESLSQEEEKHDHDPLKRTSSTASEARSSGYFSDPRSSNPRLSQLSIPESVAEGDEKDRVSRYSIRQSNIEDDEGLMMGIHHTDDFIDTLDTSMAVQSYSPGHNHGNDCSLAESAFRPRCYQVSPSHIKKPTKVSSGDLQPESRVRSHSLPSSSRHLHTAALHSTVSFSPQMSSSNSTSRTSLDSNTTSGSSNEGSSMTGSQLSLASANSDSRGNSLQRVSASKQQKPLPVVSHVNITGSMTVKVKKIANIVKSSEKNDHRTPMISDKFPSRNCSHHGPKYEMRFFPSDYSNNCASLYIDVAKSYLSKKAKQHHNSVDVLPMDISVTFSYANDGATPLGTESREIKSVRVSTEMKRIDCQSKAKGVALVASFPQLVSHSELKLSESEGRSIVICVNMSI